MSARGGFRQGGVKRGGGGGGGRGGGGGGRGGGGRFGGGRGGGGRGRGARGGGRGARGGGRGAREGGRGSREGGAREGGRGAREAREGGRGAREAREGGRGAREAREGGRGAREAREGGRGAREAREGGRGAREGGSREGSRGAREGSRGSREGSRGAREDGRSGKSQNAPKKQNQSPKAKQNSLSCPVCDLTFSSLPDRQTHFEQTNHKPLDEGKPQKVFDSMPTSALSSVPEHIRKNVFHLKDYVYHSDREPAIGVEHVLEYRLQVRPGNIETKYFCELCEVDSDLVTMMEHLNCHRHRKLYLIKAFPYVLKAQSSNEDRAQFIRRMAKEIEQEEGTKMFKSDVSVIRLAPMKTKETSQSKRKSRWEYEGDRLKRMRKALEYMESFEIDNDSEASTVTRLTEKLIAELKYHSDKLREEARLSEKVARAKELAMSISQTATRLQNAPPKQIQKNPMRIGPPGNINLKPNMAMPGGPLQPTNVNQYRPPIPAFPQMAQGMGNAQGATFSSGPPTEKPPEESKFFKKLKSLLSAVPQNSTQTPNDDQMHSKLMMLKSLLSDKRATLQNAQANQVPLQGSSMMQNWASAENVFMNQHAGQFNPNVMEMASMVQNAPANQNSSMQLAALLQNRQMNANSFIPENQNIQNQAYFPMGDGSMMQMDQSAYQQPFMEQQPGFANIPQSGEGIGFGGPMEGNFGNMGQYNAFTAEQSPYTRVSLSPNNRFNRGARRGFRSQATRSNQSGQSSRPFDDPALAEGERTLPYAKRTRMDTDRMPAGSTDQRKRRSDDEGAGNLSVDLLKKIRGKDLFTVSEILSQY